MWYGFHATAALSQCVRLSVLESLSWCFQCFNPLYQIGSICRFYIGPTEMSIVFYAHVTWMYRIFKDKAMVCWWGGGQCRWCETWVHPSHQRLRAPQSASCYQERLISQTICWSEMSNSGVQIIHWVDFPIHFTFSSPRKGLCPLP